MIYSTMKKLVTNQKNKFINEEITEESYNIWKETTQNKLDIFFACNRLTESQYKELTELFSVNE